MSITGDAGGEPTKVGVAIVDVLTGLNLQAGVLAALYRRQISGAGQRVDVTLMGAALAALVNQASSWLTAGVEPLRDGNRHPSIAPYETLNAADGSIVLAVGNDAQFGRFVAALGRPELADDTRFATNPERVAHRTELVAVLESVLAEGTVEHWTGVITGAGVACGRVNTVAEAFDFASAVGMSPRAWTVRPDGTPVAQVASPLALSATPVSYRLPPPRLGEHSDPVRRWLQDDDAGGRPQLLGKEFTR